MDNYKLGSLFDGSGGFPLAGSLCGIEPRWAAEVEPYPIAVTRERFPNMKHLGDISKINGAEIEPVDIITFGSPCQDLSVAGKQAGLKHTGNGDEETTRSGLFMEAVRIIKEMRQATNGKYPSFALWENVPGAFSSNKGEDFRTVLEELVHIVEPSAVMPDIPKGGWAYADSFVGDGWGLAWRVFDAQFWGVPQRRRRIYLVLDLGGERARDVLFEREGLRGYFAEGRTPWQDAPADAERGTGADDREGEGFDGYNGELTGNVSATLPAPDGGDNCACCIERGRDGGGLDAVAPVYAIDKESWSSGQGWDRKPGITEGGPCPTLQAGGTAHAVAFPTYCLLGNGIDRAGTIAFAANQRDEVRDIGDKAVALQAQPGMKQQTFIAVPTPPHTPDTAFPTYCLQGNGIDRADTAGCNGKGWRENESYTLNTIDRPAVVYACNSKQQSLAVSKNKANTLGANDYKEPQVIALDRTSFNQGQNANYNPEITDSGVNSTLVSRGPSAVAYSIENHPNDSRVRIDERGLVQSLPARMGTGGGNVPMVMEPHRYVGAESYPDDLHAFLADHNADAPHQQDQLQAADGVSRPLVASTHGAGGHHTKTVIYDPPRYIVRRLTPTECARLQGFPDRWGDIGEVKEFTEEEHRFWLGVRKTFDRINGRPEKDYTEKQLLAWHNSLHTDSAEYKMWGNGIALPTALYCLQGLAEALDEQPEDTDDWMN